ncbi:hypothetical protein JTE90_018537 [Oedothorax gibbosus]|uniref:Uncharacterized protein n=1 Tax=Oedothorax gibbosus TaxID=931172 RepID=A0AAV6V4G2_9ARAC|nr:hypothetical protein JTE90_018537 [Oedothorax gibbosus]
MNGSKCSNEKSQPNSIVIQNAFDSVGRWEFNQRENMENQTKRTKMPIVPKGFQIFVRECAKEISVHQFAHSTARLNGMNPNGKIQS